MANALTVPANVESLCPSLSQIKLPTPESPAQLVAALGQQHQQQLSMLRAALADCEAQRATEVGRRRAAEQRLAEEKSASASSEPR